MIRRGVDGRRAGRVRGGRTQGWLGTGWPCTGLVGRGRSGSRPVTHGEGCQAQGKQLGIGRAVGRRVGGQA